MTPLEAARNERFERLLTREVRTALEVYCLKLTRDRRDAEDLYASAILRGLRNLSKYAPDERRDPNEAFRNWMYKIAQNLWFDTVRSRTRNGRPDVAPNDDRVEHAYAVAESPDPSPLDQTHGGQADARAMAILELLSEESRETLALRFVEDLSYLEIAERAGVPIGTVRSRLHRGCRALRKRLECATIST